MELEGEENVVSCLKTLFDELIIDNEEFCGDGAPFSKVYKI